MKDLRVEVREFLKQEYNEEREFCIEVVFDAYCRDMGMNYKNNYRGALQQGSFYDRIRNIYDKVSSFVGKYTYMYESGKTFLSLILEVNTEKSTLTFVKFDENGVRKDGYYTAFFDKNNIPDMYDTEEEARIERFKKGSSKMKFKKLFEKVDYFHKITDYGVYRDIQIEVEKNPKLILTAKWEDEWKEERFNLYGAPELKGTYSDGVDIELISFNVVKITLWDRCSYDLLPPDKESTFTVKVPQKIFKPIIMRGIERKAVSMYKQELQDAKEKRINEIREELLE